MSEPAAAYRTVTTDGSGLIDTITPAKATTVSVLLNATREKESAEAVEARESSVIRWSEFANPPAETRR